MIGRPGSIPWLLGWELRLAWRGAMGRRGARARWIVLGLAVLGALALGVPLAFALRGVEAPINPLTVLGADAVALVVFTLMLSQTLAGATEALYARGDLDLLFSSPLDPRKTLTVRFAALATTAFMAFAALTLPFLIPVALFGHWRWLALLPVLAALALMASGTGLALAVGLFSLIGPRRTRAAAQILAAVIGAIFFLASQMRTLLGARTTTLWTQVGQAASDPSLRLPPVASWPLRAALGEPGPLAAVLALGAGLFLSVSFWLSGRFAADAAAAKGADVSRAHASRRPAAEFAGGAFAATFVKELRLLRRDVALVAQVLLRVLYLLPVTFLMLRNAGAHQALLLPGGAAALAILAGQVAGSLTWITVSAEDAPELLACAPAPFLTVRNAKLAAGLTPLALLLMLPLAALIVMAPQVGVAATAGAAASALAAGLLNAWHPSPGKRTEFRRRRTGSLLMSLALLMITALIGGATALFALASPWGLIPAAIAALALLGLRRSPAQVTEALAAGG